MRQVVGGARTWEFEGVDDGLYCAVDVVAYARDARNVRGVFMFHVHGSTNSLSLSSEGSEGYVSGCRGEI